MNTRWQTEEQDYNQDSKTKTGKVKIVPKNQRTLIQNNTNEIVLNITKHFDTQQFVKTLFQNDNCQLSLHFGKMKYKQPY